MNHRKSGRRKLNVKSSHKRSLLRNQVIHLITYGHLVSTKANVKETQKLAEKLDLEEENIFKDLNQFKKGSRTLPSILARANTELTYVNAEKILIGSMLQNRNYIEKIFSELKVDDFSVKEHRNIISVMYKLFKKGEKIHLQKVIDLIHDQNEINLLSQIMLKEVVSSDDDTLYRSIKAITRHRLQLQLNKIRNRIKEEESGKKEVPQGLLQDYQEILHKIKAII